jgi:hypothetical protein
MSYTLTGRIESRLASGAPALLVALALHRWWALELVALMLLIGLALDVAVYHGLLAYQPGWYAVPLGAVELGLVYGAMRGLDIMAPFWGALGLYGFAWASAQLLGHAVFPCVRLEYGESGGELGRAGVLTATAVSVIALGGVGADWSVQPPTLHLHGTVQGPLVITHAKTLVGGTVKGGIVIRADHVTLRHVTVIGGARGIEIEHADHVMLDHVHVVGNTLAGIYALDAGVMIDHCTVAAPTGPHVSGIQIMYSMGRSMSMVEHCTVAGTREGIATHSSMVDVMHNRVVDTSERGILLGEMSMDRAHHNDVVAPNGIGIICMDHSSCEIEHNTITGAKVDGSDNATRRGVAIEAYFYAEAQVHHNTVVASPGGVRSFDNSTINETPFDQ